jgi:hypothetical protein
MGGFWYLATRTGCEPSDFTGQEPIIQFCNEIVESIC